MKYLRGKHSELSGSRKVEPHRKKDKEEASGGKVEGDYQVIRVGEKIIVF